MAHEVGFPISSMENEKRRALVPGDISGIRHAGRLLFEEGYGEPVGYSNEDYEEVGARIVSREEAYGCPIICNPKPATTDSLCFSEGRTLFGWIHAVQGRKITDILVANRMTAIAWEDMFEDDRHTFWRNNDLAGEAGVLQALLYWGRSPYGTRAAVIGMGNVARGAIRILERLGSLLTVYDQNTSPLLRREIGRYDFIVNAVKWDVFRDDHIIYAEDLKKMAQGGMIVDISCDQGMGVETSRPTTIDDPVYAVDGIWHYAVDHTPAIFYKTATASISSAVCRFIDVLAGGGTDPVLDGATIIRDGDILDERIRRFQNR